MRPCLSGTLAMLADAEMKAYRRLPQ